MNSSTQFFFLVSSLSLQLRYQKCLVARPPSQKACSQAPPADSVSRRVSTSVKRGVLSLIDTLKQKRPVTELPQWSDTQARILTVTLCMLIPIRMSCTYLSSHVMEYEAKLEDENCLKIWNNNYQMSWCQENTPFTRTLSNTHLIQYLQASLFRHPYVGHAYICMGSHTSPAWL